MHTHCMYLAYLGITTPPPRLLRSSGTGNGVAARAFYSSSTIEPANLQALAGAAAAVGFHCTRPNRRGTAVGLKKESSKYVYRN